MIYLQYTGEIVEYFVLWNDVVRTGYRYRLFFHLYRYYNTGEKFPSNLLTRSQNNPGLSS
jgi:hypothetical protein